MKELFDGLIAYYKKHKYRINGIALGIIFALIIIWYGILRSVFIAICVLVGYYIGKKYESDKSFIRKIIDKILPPGRFR